ncbi:MAG: LON peptidase substrate-binding domain-containing protein, partial [Pelagibacteraceae bacterium]|nr:LON peptidase substrate-binding domain-containing protein [Pelagibacteraceae bacterium]
MTLSNSKPLLPLRDIVIFPSIVTPLFVGRKKSIKALEEVMKSDKSMVLVTQKNSEVDDPQEEHIYSYGCLSKVLQLLKLPDGTVKVLVEGLERVKILEIDKDNKKYLNCKISIIPSENDNEDTRTFASSLIKKFEKLSTLSKKDVADFSKTLKSLKNTSQVADNISSNLNIQIFEKQKLLELNDVKKRLEKIYEIIEKETSVISMEKRIRGRVKNQMEKTQREYY